MAAVGGLLILLFWVLPWLIELGEEPDESVPFREVVERIERENDQPVTITLADAELWRHLHRNCWQDGVFRSLDHAHFIRNVHSGHGPRCGQYLSASAYIGRTVDTGGEQR
ncbi:hypothetical protein [Nocardia amamiensis]|uniref:hypothetical protein n=1 Tax=Nocardia amamiensis TaxID=404578 RepID=UPI0012F4F6CF|nr:hypothetical protein [Nocardia amamiensis]